MGAYERLGNFLVEQIGASGEARERDRNYAEIVRRDLAQHFAFPHAGVGTVTIDERTPTVRVATQYTTRDGAKFALRASVVVADGVAKIESPSHSKTFDLSDVEQEIELCKAVEEVFQAALAHAAFHGRHAG